MVGDAAAGNKVSLDNVMRVVDVLDEAPEAVTRTAYAMFDAADVDGDGVIGREEYREIIRAWKGTDAGVDEAFRRLSEGTDVLSRRDFAHCGPASG
jgi:hypothetical protein